MRFSALRQLGAALAALGSLLGSGAAVAQDAINSGGQWNWSNIGQAECMARAERVLKVATIENPHLVVASYEGWYVTFENDPRFMATIHCIADDGTDSIVNNSPRVLIAFIFVTTNPNLDMNSYREGITACMVDGICPP
jgi:hypothetical protein